MAAAIVELRCITNLHVGNGDVNYNIIDNEVERDPITNYPTINSSGVKGSLRQYFTDQQFGQDHIRDIFGNEASEKKIYPGQVKILAANMIAMPGRASAGSEAYYLMTTETMIRHYQEAYDTFLGAKADLKKEGAADACDGVEIEGEKPAEVYSWHNNKLYVMKEETFRGLSLPVMARNKLDDGKSTNLWYEEIVPHESGFYFAVISDKEDLLEKFIEEIDRKVIQFGANATIGYGLCKVNVHTSK